MPYCRAKSTAACQSESGSFTRPGWLLRKSSNWRCNCKIGSGVVDVDLRFTISRLRRLTQLNNVGPHPSRMLTGNSPFGRVGGTGALSFATFHHPLQKCTFAE